MIHKHMLNSEQKTRINQKPLSEYHFIKNNHISRYQKTTLNFVYNDYVYNDIPVLAIEFHGPATMLVYNDFRR